MSLPAYIFVFSLLLLTSHAQAPLGATGSAYARLGKYFHIQGGTIFDANERVTTGQHFALDLSTAWSTGTPVWKTLRAGNPPRNSGGWGDFLTGISSIDNNTFYTFRTIPSGIGVGIYSVPTDTWSYTNYTNVALDTIDGGFSPILDPKQNLIYINGLVNTSIYDPKTNAWLSPVSNPAGMPSRIYGRASYIPDISSILYVGGYPLSQLWEAGLAITALNIGQGFSNLVRYNLLFYGDDDDDDDDDGAKPTNSYTEATGDIPSARADFCMARSEDGNKIVLQGGRTQLNANTFSITPSGFSTEIFVLDVKSQKWTKGASMTSPRIQSACVIVGDQFISWSGSMGDTNNDPFAQRIIGSEITIFNINSLQWVHSYTPPAYMSNSSTQTTDSPSQTNGPQPSSSHAPNPGPNSGAIIGGVVAGVAVVIGIVGFLIFRRRKSNQSLKDNECNTNITTDGGGGGFDYNNVKDFGPKDYPLSSNLRGPQLDKRNKPGNPQGVMNSLNPQAIVNMSYQSADTIG
ncbi:hypothetical protein BGZ76_003640 [Entomortierella beljakovae]|nr:hypothetical protein BGZ76_003640 [Entomortierella beljakovae]